MPVSEGFQLTAGDLSWPLMAVVARPRRALAPFPRPLSLVSSQPPSNVESDGYAMLSRIPRTVDRYRCGLFAELFDPSFEGEAEGS